MINLLSNYKMKKFRAGVLLWAGLSVAVQPLCAQKPLYRDASAPVEVRVRDLLGRMTLEEKVGQLRCPLGWPMYEKVSVDSVTCSAAFREQMAEAPVGLYWATLRADPWTQKTLRTGLTPALAAKALNALQRHAVEQTRLGIPLLFAEECPHGHMAIGATTFPTSLSQASTWNEDLIRRMGSAIGQEARSQGAHIGYGPVLDIAREPRWSRVEETFGEDPYLTGAMGTAFVRGMQGENVGDGRHVFSTLKHMAAYGVPRGGHNGNPADMGLRALLDEYLPAFRRAVREGRAVTAMTSYNSIDGIPCTANGYLLDSLLRRQWGFGGLVFSDLGSIDGMVGARVAENLEAAAVMALTAGTDVDLGGNAYARLVGAVRQGRVAEACVDSAVARVLRLKFAMGLFENPYVDPETAARIVHSEEHKALAREVARQGIVLLKNKGVLPLRKGALKRVAVVGPNADVAYNYLGDYTAPQAPGKVVTLFDALRERLPGVAVDYAKGCAIRDTTQTDIEAAVRLARQADVVVVAVGGSSARDFRTEYVETGAATVVQPDGGVLSDMECGEGFDRSTLTLLGDQERLIRAVAATGRPMVVVYIAGRPLDMRLASDAADALLTAWYPGEQGGHAIVDVLLGAYNPSGRLPLSVPRSVGQLPVYYSQGAQRDYMDGPGAPLYPFGYGLSYTTFAYSGLKLLPGDGKEVVQVVKCTVKNTGEHDGAEVVQLYLTDEVSSVQTPPLRLRGFRRVELKRGESRELTFRLTREDLSIHGRDMTFRLEPGRFSVSVGGSSASRPLSGSFVVE